MQKRKTKIVIIGALISMFAFLSLATPATLACTNDSSRFVCITVQTDQLSEKYGNFPFTVTFDAKVSGCQKCLIGFGVLHDPNACGDSTIVLSGCMKGNTLVLSGCIVKNDIVPLLKGSKVCFTASGNDVSFTLGPLSKDLTDQIGMGVNTFVFVGEGVVKLK